MKLKNISAYGLSLNETKEYLRVDNIHEDNLIKTLITGSYIAITNECNRDFFETSYTQSFVSASTEFISTQEIYDLSTGSLVYSSDGYYVTFDDYFSNEITYKTAISGSMPENVQIAQLMLISQWFDERASYVIGASISQLHYGIATILQPYQLVNP
jgi:hypothetical protein